MQEFLQILFYVFLLIQGVLALYFLIPPVLLLCHFLFGKNRKNISDRPIVHTRDFDFAAIITAHQDTRFIPPLVDSLCRQSYQQLTIYIVADDCDITGLHFTDPRIVLLKPEISFHAKIRSIRYAVDHFKKEHDALVIFDSDNLVHPTYFEKLNSYFQRGYRAVQTHMLSKNTSTTYARLDSIGHIYNTFVERQSKMELGLSSSILGLGIAVDTDLYRQVMYNNVLGGFDKKLQADIMQAIPRLAFAEDALVYDEKVDDGHTLEKQRTRWIYTYFKYFGINWKLFINGFRRMNFNLVQFGFIVLRPPLFITVAMAIIFMIADFFIAPSVAIAWLAILILFIISFVLIVITQSRQKGMGQALLHIPVMVLRQVSALLNIKKAGRQFLKTEHGQVMYIEDLLKNETA